LTIHSSMTTFMLIFISTETFTNQTLNIIEDVFEQKLKLKFICTFIVSQCGF
jgi:hypothetical protein